MFSNANVYALHIILIQDACSSINVGSIEACPNGIYVIAEHRLLNSIQWTWCIICFFAVLFSEKAS